MGANKDAFGEMRAMQEEQRRTEEIRAHAEKQLYLQDKAPMVVTTPEIADILIQSHLS